MVGAYLHLETVLCAGERTHHDSGVVQQDVYLGEGVVELLRALAHARQAGQVAFVEDYFGFSLLPKNK